MMKAAHLPEFRRKCVVGGTKFVSHRDIGTIEQLEVRLSGHRFPRPAQTKEGKTYNIRKNACLIPIVRESRLPMQHGERGSAPFWSTGVHRLTAQVTELRVDIVHCYALQALV